MPRQQPSRRRAGQVSEPRIDGFGPLAEAIYWACWVIGILALIFIVWLSLGCTVHFHLAEKHVHEAPAEKPDIQTPQEILNELDLGRFEADRPTSGQP